MTAYATIVADPPWPVKARYATQYRDGVRRDDIARVWGFRVAQIGFWVKQPSGFGPAGRGATGGLLTNTVEPFLVCKRGRPKQKTRTDTSWWVWPRGRHSEKPDAFYDLVESMSPGPYLEMFSRRPRLGWDTWGNEVDTEIAL